VFSYFSAAAFALKRFVYAHHYSSVTGAAFSGLLEFSPTNADVSEVPRLILRKF
jgi:hypothetical protein